MLQKCVMCWIRICLLPVMSTSVQHPSISSVAPIPVSVGRFASARRWPTMLATAVDSPSSLTFDHRYLTVVSHIHAKHILSKNVPAATEMSKLAIISDIFFVFMSNIKSKYFSQLTVQGHRWFSNFSLEDILIFQYICQYVIWVIGKTVHGSLIF